MRATINRPGFGQRHPELAALLREQRPAGSHDVSWLDGAMPLRRSAYTTPADVPRDVVGSVRCIVRVGAHIVVCENEGGAHPWPGGRREPGESYIDTAAREVHEETGWLLDRDSLQLLGWLHLEHLAPRRPNDPYPYPDVVQVVFCGSACERDGGPDVTWADTDGYELGSRLLTVDEARKQPSIDPLAQYFFDLLPDLM